MYMVNRPCTKILYWFSVSPSNDCPAARNSLAPRGGSAALSAFISVTARLALAATRRSAASTFAAWWNGNQPQCGL